MSVRRSDWTVVNTMSSNPEPAPCTVLVVEDDQGVRESLAMVLEYQGYDVVQAVTGEEGLSLAAECSPALIVLDLNLPGIDGVEVCRRVRDTGRAVAILMLTARDQVGERVRGLDAGADDYLPKPFALDELLARVRALLRSFGYPDPQGSASPLTLSDLRLDPTSRQVERGGQSIELTKLEFDLLALLLNNIDRVLSREEIVETVWGHDDDLGSNSLEVFISTLRRKTEVGAAARLIHTVRGYGYVARVGA